MELKLTLIGHPFIPLGIGRALRVSLAACRAVAIDAKVRDVWNYQAPEAAQVIQIVPFLTAEYGAVNLFYLNGDEIGAALDRMGPLSTGYNIVLPNWELPRYPEEWARELERFDEVWAASKFVQQSIANAVSRSVTHMPLPTEISLSEFSERYVGSLAIPENCYVFLFFFDYRSYASRKNPAAVVECFRRLMAARPWARTRLVIKTHGAESSPAEAEKLMADLEDIRERVVILNKTMSESEVHNLIRSCDAFVSLHRSEGYGLGIAEAMYLGLPVIATGYSGNMDFMSTENSIPIKYHLVPVPDGAYPHSQDQVWAEPDLEQATARMIDLLDDPKRGRELGKRASRSMRVNFSYRAAGLRYLQRLTEIATIDSLL